MHYHEAFRLAGAVLKREYNCPQPDRAVRQAGVELMGIVRSVGS